MTRLTTARSLKATLAVGILTALTLTTRGDAATPPPIILVNPTPSDCFGAPGCLDASFGTAGKSTANFGDGIEYAYASAVQTDGKTVVAGPVTPGTVSPVTWSWAIARFAADGTLDAGFGSNGLMTAPAGLLGTPRALAVQSDGKIVVAGSDDVANSVVVLRFLGTGALDPTFGTGGKATAYAHPNGVFVMAMKIQTDGKLVLVVTPTVTDTTVVRLKTNGARDMTFGKQGAQTISIAQNFGGSLAFQSTGKIIVGGRNASGAKDFALARLTASGSLDTSFGSSGTRMLDFLGQNDSLESIAVAADDSIVAAGYAYPTSEATNAYVAFARFTANGTLSTSFGSSGRVLLNMHPVGSDSAHGVALQADGKIVFAGRASESGNGFAIVGRLTANGALDSSFGTGGITETAFGVNDRFAALTLANGQITAAGYSYTPAPSTNPNVWLVARYFQ